MVLTGVPARACVFGTDAEAHGAAALAIVPGVRVVKGRPLANEFLDCPAVPRIEAAGY
jgi:hypothetical protein